MNVFFPVNETLDSVFDASDDEEEQDAIVTQVLDEIGIDMTSKVIILEKSLAVIIICKKCNFSPQNSWYFHYTSFMVVIYALPSN